MTGQRVGNGSAVHWDAAYARRGADAVSWYQAEPQVSLDLLDELDVNAATSVIDVGGGASLLAERLVERGFGDVTVLDVSAEALAAAQARAGAGATVQWLHEDLLSWAPRRHYDVWHDRAVFHFLVEEPDRDRYLAVVRSALARGGAVVIGAFAADGPDTCSGLPVARYSLDELLRAFGGEFEIVRSQREEHVTPRGVVQPFTWIAARRS